jgi:hypothetical protein
LICYVREFDKDRNSSVVYYSPLDPFQYGCEQIADVLLDLFAWLDCDTI